MAITEDQTQAVEALIADLRWQVDQHRSRSIKTAAGKAYTPAHYKRGLEAAIEDGDEAVVAFVQKYVHKAPSTAYKTLEAGDALDLSCECLVADETKPYAELFTDEDRAAACERLGAHRETIDARNAERRARIDAARAKIRNKGVPSRLDLDAALQSRPRPRRH